MSIASLIFYGIDKIEDPSLDEYLRNLDEYKGVIDRTPDKFLAFHLDWCLEREFYELAEYINKRIVSTVCKK